MAERYSRTTIGMFDREEAVERFPKDCVDLAFDYLHKRYADINLTDLNAAYDRYGSINTVVREQLYMEIKKQGKVFPPAETEPTGSWVSHQIFVEINSFIRFKIK